jgi:alpha-N-arabinofuranosidase
MRNPARLALLSLLFLPAALPILTAQAQAPAIISVDAAHPGAPIASTMFGIFFEDINFGADGGLYPELIKNRSFEFSEPLTGWKVTYNIVHMGLGAPKGEIAVHSEAPLNPSNPHYLRVRAYQPGYGITNSGFRGIGVEQGKDYRFSAWVRTSGPKALRATLTDPDGHEIGTASLTGLTGAAWAHYEAILRPTATADHATFNLFLDEPGTVDLDMVSLYPTDTWANRPNGLRKDLVQLLHDMHPGFLRFPGGCIVEGRQLATRYRWKTTVGDINQRQTLINRWNNEFDHRPTPDYFQSFGLGFYEYFQLAEDIGAKPLPILNCGMACEFNSGETAKLADLRDYVQDALDLIEFANGPVTTPWGKLRASMGHPAPFHLTMIGIGNEQWGPHYVERYKVFAAALKAQHPEIQLVVAAGPSPDGDEFDSLWATWRKEHADIVDEHYYQSPDWFLANSGRYDHYDRSGPKVFAGEYAAQTTGAARPDNRNNWQAALSEAAFMTGLERNADVVRMASYAPLLAHKDAWQWVPDAIWFDNLHSYGTPNYYVQRVFASNVGTRIVPVTPHATDGLYTVADLDGHTLIVKAVNATPAPRPATIQINGATPSGNATVTTLASDDLKAENSFEHPTNIAPTTSTLTIPANSTTLPVTLPPNSLTVYRIPIQ